MAKGYNVGLPTRSGKRGVCSSGPVQTEVLAYAPVARPCARSRRDDEEGGCPVWAFASASRSPNAFRRILIEIVICSGRVCTVIESP